PSVLPSVFVVSSVLPSVFVVSTSTLVSSGFASTLVSSGFASTLVSSGFASTLVSATLVSFASGLTSATTCLVSLAGGSSVCVGTVIACVSGSFSPSPRAIRKAATTPITIATSSTPIVHLLLLASTPIGAALATACEYVLPPTTLARSCP